MNTLQKGEEWEGTAGGSHSPAAGLKGPGHVLQSLLLLLLLSEEMLLDGLWFSFLETALRPTLLQDSAL